MLSQINAYFMLIGLKGARLDESMSKFFINKLEIYENVSWTSDVHIMFI